MNAIVEQLAKVRDPQDLPADLMGKRFNHTPAKQWQETCAYIADSLKQYDADSWEDYTHEIADGLIPVYYKLKWEEMNDLNLWAEDDIENEADELISGLDTDFQKSPLWQIVDAYLFTFYSKAIDAVIEYINEQEEEATE